jgi:hypothetical protein
VQPGEVALDASLVTDADAFHDPTALAGTPLVPAVYTDADAFFAPVVNHELAASLLADADTIFSAAIVIDYVLAPSFVDEDVFIYTPVNAEFYYIFPTHVNDPESFFVPVVTATDAGLVSDVFVDTDVFYVPTVQRKKTQGGGGGGNPGTVTHDLKYATTVTMESSGLVVALQMITSSNKTVNTRMALYEDDAGVPGALLGQTEVLTSISSGTNEYEMLVPVSVLLDDVVWVALHADGNVNWLLSISAGGSRYNTDLFTDGIADPFGVASVDNKKAPVVIVLLESADAVVLPDLHVETDTFFAPSISKTYEIEPPFLTSENFFYPTVTTGVTHLTPDAYSSDDAFYAPLVAPGDASVQPSLVDDVDVIWSPFVGASDSDVFSAQVLVDDVFHEPTVTKVGGAALPVLVEDADVIHAAIVTPRYPLVPALVASDDAVYAAAVTTGSRTLQPSHATDVDQHWISVLVRGIGDAPLLPEMVQDGDVFYAPSTGNRRRARRVTLSGGVTRPDILARTDNERALDGDASHAEIELEGNDA